MFIKQVIIEGFKSYKDQIAVDPFSEKINVVGTPGLDHIMCLYVLLF